MAAGCEEDRHFRDDGQSGLEQYDADQGQYRRGNQGTQGTAWQRSCYLRQPGSGEDAAGVRPDRRIPSYHLSGCPGRREIGIRRRQ